MIQITEEMAHEEVQKWLNHRGVRQSKRDALQNSIDSLIEEFADGTLRLDEDFNIHQTLRFPLKNENGDITLSSLKYNSRARQNQINLAMSNVKANNGLGMITAYISALTGVVKGLVDSMDTEDHKVGQIIASFFF